MNTNQEQPDCKISKGGTLIIAPPDISPLEKKIDSRLEEFTAQINRMLSSTFTIPDYANTQVISWADVYTQQNKTGYYVVPRDGLLTLRYNAFNSQLVVFCNLPNKSLDSLTKNERIKYSIMYFSDASGWGGITETAFVKSGDKLVFCHCSGTTAGYINNRLVLATSNSNMFERSALTLTPFSQLT